MLNEKKKKSNYFKVTYKDPIDNKIVSLKSNKISDSSLGMSFIAISDFIFDTSGVVVDPSEEALSKKFAHIEKIHLSIYSIITIEEIGAEHEGLRFKNDKSNLHVLPSNNLQ